MNYIFNLTLGRIINPNIAYQNNLKEFIGIFISRRSTDWDYAVGNLWFISALFVTEIFFYWLIKIIKDRHIDLVYILFLSTILGFIYVKYVKITLPWNVDILFFSVVFYGLGYLYKVYKSKFQAFINFKFFIAFLFLNILSSYYNCKFSAILRVEMWNNTYGNYFLFYTSAISGILAVIIFVQLIEKHKLILQPLLYIGKNTMIILAFQSTIAFLVLNKLILTWHLSYFPNRLSKLLGFISYDFLAVLIMIPIIFTINKYIPFVLGKSIRLHNYKCKK